MARNQEDEIDVSLILSKIQVNDSYMGTFHNPVLPKKQTEPGISIRSPHEINRNASIIKSPRSITSHVRRKSSSSSPEIQILDTVKSKRIDVQRQNSSSSQRKDSEVLFSGFQTRYSKMKLIKSMIHRTSDGLVAHLEMNRDNILRGWERTVKSNIPTGSKNTVIERDASCSPVHPSTNNPICKEILPNNNLPIVNERLRHPSQNSIVMGSPTLFSPSDDFRNAQTSSILNSSQNVPIGNGRLRHPSQSSSIVMNSPTVLSPSDDFRNPSPRSLTSPEVPRIRSKNHDRIQCNNSSSSLWNPDPPQTLNSPTSESRLSARNPDPPLSSFRQNSPSYDSRSLSRNPDPPHYNVQPTYENRICSSNPDPPQHNLQTSLEQNPFWRDPRRSYVENNESTLHTIQKNNDSIRRIGSIDINDNDKQHSTQQPININSHKQTDSHVEQCNPENSEVKDTVDIDIAQRCTVYMKQLKCHKGDYCEKLHKFPREDKVVCKYFKEEGGCRRSNTDCWFWHPGEEVVKYVPNNDAPLLVQPMGHVLGYIKEDKAKNPDKYKNKENPEVVIPSAVGNINHTPLVIPSAVGNANHTPLGQRQIGRLDPNHSPLLPHLKKSISTNNVNNSNVQELGSPSTASKSESNSPSINHIITNSIGKTPIEVSRIKRSKPAKVGAPRKKTIENIDNISNGPIISENVSSKAYKIPKKNSINKNSTTLINEKIENMKTVKVDAPRKKIVEQQNNISRDQIVSDSSSKITKKSSINENNTTLINEKISENIKTKKNTKTVDVSKNQSSPINNENNENENTSNNNVENLIKTLENAGKNVKSNRTKQEQNSKKGHENKKEKSSKKNKETDTHMKRKARPISDNEEEENAAEKTKVLKKQSSNWSSKEKEDKMQGKKSNKPTKKANKSKRPKIDSSDESDEDSSQAVVTKSKKLKSSSDESEEEIQPKKSIKRNKKKFIIDSDEESEGDHQPLKSGNESEEENQVKKPKNFTKKIDNPSMSRIDSSSESEKEVPHTVVTKNKRSKSKIDVEKQHSVKVKEEPIETISKVDISNKKNNKKPIVIAEITLSDSDEESEIVKSESFLNEEVDGVNPVRERKALDDVFWKINEVFDILESASPWRRTPNQTEQDLYTVLNELNLERIEDDKYPHIYNLDLNFRQLFIYFSEVNDRVQEHAWKCKHRYPNCKDIPDQHKEDMSCCT